jgi:hypothetical protein
MYHLKEGAAAAYLSKTPQPCALGQRPLLAGAEMKKTQYEAAGAIADLREQHTPASKYDFGEIYETLNHGLIAALQTADGRDPRAVLVTRGQVKEQVPKRADVKTL